MDRIRHFFTKIVGVTFLNDDGSDRQTIVPKCHIGEQLVLIHKADNLFDENAIEVRRPNGEQIGHLRNWLAPEVAQRNKEGYKYIVLVSDVTGGTKDKYYGCNLLIVEAAPGVTQEEAQQYVDEHIQAELMHNMLRARRRRMSGELTGCTPVLLCVLFAAGGTLWWFSLG
jgi:hypothetical protein